MAAAAGALPGELTRVDQHEAGRHLRVAAIGGDVVGREAGEVGQRGFVQRDRRGPSSAGCRRLVGTCTFSCCSALPSPPAKRDSFRPASDNW
jgi:hypothetical protein